MFGWKIAGFRSNHQQYFAIRLPYFRLLIAFTFTGYSFIHSFCNNGATLFVVFSLVPQKMSKVISIDYAAFVSSFLDPENILNLIVNLNLLWSEFVETMRRFDLLLQILVTHRLSVTTAHHLHPDYSAGILVKSLYSIFSTWFNKFNDTPHPITSL